MSLALEGPSDSPDNDLFAGLRTATDRRVSERAARASRARQASRRRQKIDPTTCDRDYSPAEFEFIRAIQTYKQTNGRMFPSWDEVLEVLQSLGYRKPA